MGNGGFSARGVGMISSGYEADGGFGCDSGGGGGGGDDGGGDGVGDKRVTGLFGGICSEEIPAFGGDVRGSFWASTTIGSVTEWMDPIMLPPSSILVNVIVSWA